MNRNLLGHFVRSAEFTYAVVALFALTQGPVYRLWSESGTYLRTSPEPTMLHVYFASFIILQFPALLLVAKNIDKSFFEHHLVWFLTVFLGWLGLSVIWSTLARQSLPEYVALLFTTSFGLYLAVRFSLGQLWRVIGVSMGLGLVLSLFAIWRNWNSSVDLADKYWIGIYYNRNSLAPVAAVAVLASFGIFVTAKNNFRFVLLHRIAALSLGAMGIAVLYRSESQTSLFALLISVSVVGFWLFLRWLFFKLKLLRRSIYFAAVSAVVAASLGIFFAFRAVRKFAVSDETATFNYRNGLWSQNWTGFLEKSLFGWGWMAARYTEDFQRMGVQWGAIETKWSHNGYHDLLLGGGILAAVLFAGVVFTAVRQFDSWASPRNAIPQFLVMCFVLAAATQESFFIGSHFLWALLIAALFAGREVKSSLIKE